MGMGAKVQKLLRGLRRPGRGSQLGGLSAATPVLSPFFDANFCLCRNYEGVDMRDATYPLHAVLRVGSARCATAR
jgi:hypothetical protein